MENKINSSSVQPPTLCIMILQSLFSIINPEFFMSYIPYVKNFNNKCDKIFTIKVYRGYIPTA